MNPKLTDQAVADLPLHAGRAELLEEIMHTTVLDHAAAEATPARRRNRWLVPAAAAATVALVATVPLWWGAPGSGSDAESGRGDVAGAPAPKQGTNAALEHGAGYRTVLLAAGWEVEHASEDPPYGGGIAYAKGDAWLEVTWSPAESYADYVEDREHIVSPPAPGVPVEVLGGPGQLWAYSAHDHTVIREVDRGHWMEIRASGPDRAGYLALLEQLRLVDRDEFEAALPAAYVTTAERTAATDALLDGIAAVAQPLLPPGAAPDFTSAQSDPYQLGAKVAGTVACAWLSEFEQATTDGDAARADEAARVLATSREWPVLLDMDERGDYPEVVWEYADQVAAGRMPEGFREGLGC